MTAVCDTCHGSGRIAVGMSFPPNSTINVTIEYDPCPDCNEPPHSFYALKRAREIKAAKGGQP